MNYILYHDDYSDDSPEWIVEAMTEPCSLVKKLGKNKWRKFDQKTLEWEKLPSIMEILHGNNHVINWGNRIFKDDGYFCLNKPSAIGKASNKAKARRFLHEGGVKIPDTRFYGEKLEFPVIARPPRHERGHDFHVLNDTNDLFKLSSKEDLSDWYFSKIFDKTEEFRAHVAHGKILMMNIKAFHEGDPLSGNFANIGVWKALRWSNFHEGMCQESLKAINVLGLDYGAVDILYNSHNDSWVICEVNTAPDVRVEYSCSKYAGYFSWLIRHNFPKHFPLENGTNIFYSELLSE